MNPSCLRCGDPYTYSKGRRSHFCPPCRIIRKREGNTARMAARRATASTIRANLDEWLPAHADPFEYDTRLFPLIDQYVETVDTDTGLIADRMPAGANSPAGPDEGYSTYFTDLGEWLDQHAAEVASHPWFAANPHWTYELHDPEQAAVYLAAA